MTVPVRAHLQLRLFKNLSKSVRPPPTGSQNSRMDMVDAATLRNARQRQVPDSLTAAKGVRLANDKANSSCRLETITGICLEVQQ